MAGGAGNFGGTVIDIADATDNIGHRSCDNKIRHNMTERIHIMRIGQGYDVHRLTEGRDLILGGVKIPYDKGLLALQMERFEQKATLLNERLKRCQGNWEDAFFITLARNFGFGLNGDAFETWAHRLLHGCTGLDLDIQNVAGHGSLDGNGTSSACSSLGSRSNLEADRRRIVHLVKMGGK